LNVESWPGWVATGDDRVVEIIVEHGQQAGAREKLALVAIAVVLSKLMVSAIRESKSGVKIFLGISGR
jgi:hypothetical protein